MLRKAGVAAGTAIAAGALALTSLPGTAGAAPAPSPSRAATAAPAADPAVLHALQRDFGLTASEAEARVANEYRAAGTQKELGKKLGDDFAGAWLTGATSRLVVATTDAAQRDAITGAGASAKVVRHSMAELDAAKGKLDRAAQKEQGRAPELWSVDVRSNSVVVRTGNPAAARAFVAKSGADADAVRIVKSAEKPRTYYDVRGGDAYYMGGGRCSVGFAVTKGTQHGFVTAGHCGRTGTATTGYNQVAQGTFRGSTFPGNDYAWVGVNTNWQATPYVKGSSGNVRVAGSQQAAVGATICRSGSTTGWHCGTIQQHNTSVTYPQGTVRGVTRTSVCAEPGDSGGSFISGSQAQGMTSGGSGNCRSGGTTYYQPVNPALQVYGLTLRVG
ncbi:S1 family peptidase [Streptomyces sp. ODS28]|uniref:S1 family peptidase n=1 Tax=Streptomyces sp. ODS28 TaxID=3136688 RepID=UPI0031E7BE78